MKKYNRALTINVSQDVNESPSTLKQEKNYLEFRDGFDGVDSEDDKCRTESQFNNIKRHKVVEFEQFNADNNDHNNNNKIQKQKGQKYKKKQFMIQIPQMDANKEQMNKSYIQNNQYQQPPAPSNKIYKMQKSFIFPNIKKNNNFNDDRNNIKCQNDTINSIDSLKISFQRERQEFYRQRSKLEKQLMVKDGQIEMLQKIVTNKYSPTQANLNRKQQYQQQIGIKMQQLAMQKDLEINELLEKINELSQNLDAKNQQLIIKSNQNFKLQALNESLRNQIYLYEKRQVKDKMTQKYISLKECKIPIENTEVIGSSQFGIKGLQSLQKRLESLKLNRIELEGRGKIKSDIAYCKTSQNKNKGIFDFQGRFYDRQGSKYMS